MTTPPPTTRQGTRQKGRKATNPLYAAQSEAEFQQTVVESAQRNGWRVDWVPDFVWRAVFAQWKEKGSRRGKHWSPSGKPDLMMVRVDETGVGRLVFAELKSMTGRVKSTQQEWIDDLRTVPGVEAYIWFPDDWDEVEMTLAREAVAA